MIQRERVAEALACANEPALCCPVPPAPVTSGTKVQIISKAKGWIYSNPDPTRALLAENRIRYFDYSNEFNMLEQIAVQQQLRVVGGVLNGVDGKLPAGGAVRSSTFSPPPTPSASTIGKGNPGAKQMAGIDLGSMTRTKPIGGLGLSEVNAAGLNCLDAWKAQKATLQIGLNTINSRLSSIV